MTEYENRKYAIQTAERQLAYCPCRAIGNQPCETCKATLRYLGRVSPDGDPTR